MSTPGLAVAEVVQLGLGDVDLERLYGHSRSVSQTRVGTASRNELVEVIGAADDEEPGEQARQRHEHA